MDRQGTHLNRYKEIFIVIRRIIFGNKEGSTYPQRPIVKPVGIGLNASKVDHSANRLSYLVMRAQMSTE